MRSALRFTVALVLLLTVVPAVVPREPVAALGQVSVYMTGLNVPIALAFSSDGRIFFNERNTGNIRIIQGGTLLPTPFYTLPNTNSVGERGLLGLALAPGFPADPWVYAYQTYNDAANGTINNRIVRIQASGNVGVSMQLLLRLPNLGATNHNGGVIAFGPDGKLYIVVGENAVPANAQNPMTPLGKVLRMNPDGSVPTDNPFFGSALWDNYVYTYGHRNMFGLAFHPFTGRVYVTENGPNCNDEINLLSPGANYGWGPSAVMGACPPPPDINITNRDGPSPVLPLWSWWNTICPTNAAIYAGPGFPSWQGDMFMGDCNNRNFHRLHLVPPTYDTVASDTILWTAPSYIMDVEQGPDGAIWITTPTTIYRYWDSGRPPIASFTAAPNPTTVGTPVAFDGSASTDPDGTIVSYAWDFGDSQGAAGVTTSHTYAAVGTYVAALTVTDNESFTNRTTRAIVVQGGPVPPVAAFTATPSPAPTLSTVSFDASASYDADGTIVSYAWEFGDSATGTGVTTTHRYTHGTFIVNLTVVDNQSLSDTVSHVLIVDNPPSAHFLANPNPTTPGTAVTFDGGGTDDTDSRWVGFNWTFGDGGTGTGRVTAHAYASSGTYTATLTATDDSGLSGTDTHQILVDYPPRANIAYSPTVVYKGVAVSFSGLGSTDQDGPIASYAWDFGDGATASGPLPTHTYAAKGPFTVSLTVADQFGITDRTTTIVVVQNRRPVIISSDPGPGAVSVESGPGRAIIVVASDPDGDALHYAWTVNGAAAGGDAATLDFASAAPGAYRVNVTVSDGSLSDWREWTVTVTPASGLSPAAWWPLAILLAAVLLVLVLAAWRRRKRRTRW